VWLLVFVRCRNEELTKRFEELDKDRNGVLSPQEVVSVIRDMMGVDEQRAVALMQMFDHNQDGSLDKSEFMHLWASMFGH
jgi:Ca2+-binding EF-hand superfamily protein